MKTLYTKLIKIYNKILILFLFIISLNISCNKEEDQKEDLLKEKINLLASSNWFGPIEVESFYYDKNNKLIKKSITGQHDTYLFSLNKDFTALINYCTNTPCQNGQNEGTWEVENNILKVILSNEDPNRYLNDEPTVIFDHKILNVNDYELILEFISEYNHNVDPTNGQTLDPEISYLINQQKFILSE